MNLQLSLLLATITINCVVSTPGCNYAADGSFFYPTGACVRRSPGNGGAFKYICNTDNELLLYTYPDETDCDKKVKKANIDSDPQGIEDFSCDGEPCVFSEQCDVLNCENGCDDCINNPDDGDTFSITCLTWIEDECIGDPEGFTIMDTCIDGTPAVNTQNFYFDGGECGTPLFDGEVKEDGQCNNVESGGEYFTVSCDNVADGAVDVKECGKGKKKGKKSKDKGYGYSAFGVDGLMGYDGDNGGDIKGGNGDFFKVFGVGFSLLDMVLIGSNVFLVFVICLILMYCSRCCCKGRGKENYVKGCNDDYDQESKALKV